VRRARFRRHRVVVAAVIYLVAAGCGYSIGYRAPPSVRTIAVPIFNNATFPLRREIEYELTTALRKDIQSRTPLQLADSEQADLVLYGTVMRFREGVVADGRRDQKIESMVTIEVEIIVEDFVNRERWTENVAVQEPFSPQIGETEDEVRSRAIVNLAEKILGQLAAWETE